MIAIVDYGLGNISAFSNVYKRMGIDATVASSSARLAGARKIILPGVGAFDHAIQLLDLSGMRPALNELVLDRKVPVLGVCVGMQMFADSSDEGKLPGLGWIPGRVRSLRSFPQAAGQPLPHMGWNDVCPLHPQGLFAGLEQPPRFYFLHSFVFDSTEESATSATCTYGAVFTCAVASGNVHGVQFHPEKSHQNGARLLRNFAEL